MSSVKPVLCMNPHTLFPLSPQTTHVALLRQEVYIVSPATHSARYLPANHSVPCLPANHNSPQIPANRHKYKTMAVALL